MGIQLNQQYSFHSMPFFIINITSLLFSRQGPNLMKWRGHWITYHRLKSWITNSKLKIQGDLNPWFRILTGADLSTSLKPVQEEAWKNCVISNVESERFRDIFIQSVRKFGLSLRCIRWLAKFTNNELIFYSSMKICWYMQTVFASILESLITWIPKYTNPTLLQRNWIQ